MWEINSISQYTSFLYAIFMGNALGVIYDIFSIDRALFKRTVIFVFFQDILFWVISAFAFFSFSVVFANGQLRGYLLFGTLLGFLLFKLTISRLFWLLVRPFKKFICLLKIKYLNFLEKMVLYFKKAVHRIKRTFKKILFLKNFKNNKIIEKNS